jgi:uncharacterized protein (TIGR02246 family)
MTSTLPTTGLDTEQHAVREVIDGVYTAWADNDADAFAALYLADATVVQPGVYKNSREVVRTSMAAAFAGPLKGSTVIDQLLNVRILGDDVAVVISEGGVMMSGETEVPAQRRVRATWVLAKRGGKWLIAAYHNSPAH